MRLNKEDYLKSSFVYITNKIKGVVNMSKYKVRNELGSYASADIEGFLENLNENLDCRYHNVQAWRDGTNKILKIYYPMENSHNLMDILQPINYNLKYFRFMRQLKKNSQLNGIYNGYQKQSFFDETEIKMTQNILNMTNLPTTEFIYTKHIRNKEFEYILPKATDSVILVVPKNYHNTYEVGTYNFLFRLMDELSKMEVK